MNNPNPLMLVRIAQGDAYGLATEYIKPDQSKVKFAALEFIRYCTHPELPIKAGHYTDDTQMSIAVVEALLIQQRRAVKEDFAKSFVRCYQRDPRPGYSKRIAALLAKAKDGTNLLEIADAQSEANGAAMRSVPLGVMPNPLDCVEMAKTQAMITHNTPGGIASSALVALMSHYALWTNQPFQNMNEWLNKVGSESGLSFDLSPWDGSPVDGADIGRKTARAVKTLLETQKTLVDVAKTVITWGGDTDSVLAIAWGIASTRMTEKLPFFFTNELENGQYGYNYLVHLGEELMDKYG